MSARAALKTKWTKFTPRNETHTLMKDSTLLIIADNSSDPDEFKLHFEELMAPENLFCPEILKIHVMFASIRSLATEFVVQVERRSGLCIARANVMSVFEDEL